MLLTATKLRANVYAILDQILATGEPIDIERNGKMLRLQAVEPGLRLDRPLPSPNTIAGASAGLAERDWSHDWSELTPPVLRPIELPDELYRRVQSKSALEGRAVREVATALFSSWMDGGALSSTAAARPAPTVARPDAWLGAWSALGAAVSDATDGSGGLVDELSADRR